MIRRTIPATLFVDGTKHNTVPGLSKTVSIVPIELIELGVDRYHSTSKQAVYYS